MTRPVALKHCDELVISKLDSIRIEQAWVGTSEFALPKCDGEEMSGLAPIQCGTGRACRGLHGECLEDSQ